MWVTDSTTPLSNTSATPTLQLNTLSITSWNIPSLSQLPCSILSGKSSVEFVHSSKKLFLACYELPLQIQLSNWKENLVYPCNSIGGYCPVYNVHILDQRRNEREWKEYQHQQNCEVTTCHNLSTGGIVRWLNNH